MRLWLCLYALVGVCMLVSLLAHTHALYLLLTRLPPPIHQLMQQQAVLIAASQGGAPFLNSMIGAGHTSNVLVSNGLSTAAITPTTTG